MTEITCARSDFNPSIRAGAPIVSIFGTSGIREKLETLRDVTISLGLQLLFRAAILLRRWNY